ncbi:MAG: tRNA (adenosine(37)-N6)-dimethylallyltransferase MiaA [Bacilli bacterium]
MLPIIVIVGPTGVGKTKLSIELAKLLNGEIINADSMQVYKGLNIGTAKVNSSEMEGISHHLLDICEVDANYTVFDYQRDCRQKIAEIQSENKTPIIVGGTGLYIKAALYNYDFKEEEEFDPCSDKTNAELYKIILQADSSSNIHPNNRQRLVRAYNKIINGSVNTQKGNSPLYNFVTIGLTTPRDNLYNIINNRVDTMITTGLIKEAEFFYKKGIRSKSLMTGIGYKELYEYFDGLVSLDVAVENIKHSSRKYAKRQDTFFKHQLPVNWIETNYQDFSKTVAEAITIIKKEKENF